MNKTNVLIFRELRKQLVAYSEAPSSYCERAVDFTKARKLTFVMTFCILINMIKKTLSLELYENFEKLDKKSACCTASAFSQARHKLKPIVFIDMNKKLLDLYYSNHGSSVKRWLNFRLEAVDGNSLNLPDREIEIFSGYSVRSIEQDFYAAIFTANAHSILINDCKAVIEEQTKNREGTYKVNKNISLGLLKTVLIKLFLAPDFEPIIQEIQIEFCKHVVLYKRKPSTERKKRKRNIDGKYVTLKNYKRAI